MKNEKSAGSFNTLLAVYSFILTVIVIWIHSGDAAADSEIYRLVHRFFSETLGQMAVPGFFIISGYLFFRNMQKKDLGKTVRQYEASFFIKQWKKRSKSLLIPYLLWNVIYMAVYVISGRAGLNIETVIDGILFYRFNPVFWYIYQLIILTLLSPVVYYLVKGKAEAVFSVIALFVLAVFYDRLSFHIVNEDALFYYALGAALSLHAKSFIESEKNGALDTAIKNSELLESEAKDSELLESEPKDAELLESEAKDAELLESESKDAEPSEKEFQNHEVFGNETDIWLTILGMSVTGIGISAFLKGTAYPLFGVISLRVVMNVCLFSVLKLLKAGSFRIYPFMKQTFFIYAVHYLEIRLIRMLLNGILPKSLILFVIMPGLCIALSYFLAVPLKKYMPRIYKLLCGGR